MKAAADSPVRCRTVLLAIALLWWCVAGHAQGGVAGADRKVELHLPAQPMDQALKSLAQQTGVQLLFRADIGARDVEARPLQGTFTLQDALHQLLEGSGLAFEFMDTNTVAITIARASADTVNVLETVNVFASLDNELSVGSKAGQSLRDTPKSVTVVTRERIEAQNLTSLAEALTQTTGVTAVSHSPSAVDSFFYSRGFRVQTLQLDGGAPAYTGGFGSYLAPDTAEFDHIEMLRGLARFGMFHLKNPGVGKPLFPRQRIDELHAMSFDASWWGIYGLGWFRSTSSQGQLMVWHAGASYGARAFLGLLPAQNVAVAIVSNSDTDSIETIRTELLARFGYQEKLWSRDRTGEKDPPPSFNDQLRGEWSGIVHTYRGDVPLLISVTADGVVDAKLGLAPRSRIGNARLKDMSISAELAGSIDTDDAQRRPNALQLTVNLYGERLVGDLTTKVPWPRQGRAGDFVSHWVELRRNGASTVVPSRP